MDETEQPLHLTPARSAAAALANSRRLLAVASSTALLN